MGGREGLALQEQLDAVLATGVPGAAVVTVRPAGRVEGAAGFADVRTGEVLTPEHRFRIASVTKIFVAALVLRLVAEGLLELDAEAAPFVEGITIRQLLNHTSGLPDFIDDLLEFFEPYRRDPARGWELSRHEEFRMVLERPREFAPGAGWAYHGSNYIALGLVVEEMTGMPLRDALRERVLTPLGLTRTELVEGPLRSDCARAYIPPENPYLPGEGDTLLDVTELDFPFNRAGGGIVSTAGEVAAMLRALLGGRFLPEDLRAEMLDAVDSDWAETDRYGLGIGQMSTVMRRQRSPCGPAWGHIGFSLGYTTLAISSEDGERQVVVWANGSAATEEAENVFWDVAGRLAWDLYCVS